MSRGGRSVDASLHLDPHAEAADARPKSLDVIGFDASGAIPHDKRQRRVATIGRPLDELDAPVVHACRHLHPLDVLRAVEDRTLGQARAVKVHVAPRVALESELDRARARNDQFAAQLHQHRRGLLGGQAKDAGPVVGVFESVPIGGSDQALLVEGSRRCPELRLHQPLGRVLLERGGVPREHACEEAGASVGVGRVPGWLSRVVGVLQLHFVLHVLPGRVIEWGRVHIDDPHQLLFHADKVDILATHRGPVGVTGDHCVGARHVGLRIVAPATGLHVARLRPIVVPGARGRVEMRRGGQQVQPSQAAPPATVEVEVSPLVCRHINIDVFVRSRYGLLQEAGVGVPEAV